MQHGADMNKPEEALNRAIGGRLRAAREARGLSLSQLGELTGGNYSKSRISNYEQGVRRISLEGAQALAEALGNVTAAHVLCLDDQCAANPAELDLLKAFRAMDEAQREQLLTSVKGG
jgi:transcriptional regulator with XRE-family HTH domain